MAINGAADGCTPRICVDVEDGVDTCMFGHADLNVCVRSCNSDVDCPAGWVCDLRAKIRDASGNEFLACANPNYGT